jgi:hypothetical protein
MGDKKSNWIVTHMGKQFFPFDPKPEQVDIRDIANSLAMQCRWGGHTTTFYSIAEHVVRCTAALQYNSRCEPLHGADDRRVAMLVLLHDAHEAYTMDLPRPLKRGLDGYEEVASAVQGVIYEALDLAPPTDEEQETIKFCDNLLLTTEARDVTTHPFDGVDWIDGNSRIIFETLPKPMKEQIEARPWQIAKTDFLTYFRVLGGVIPK